MFNELLILSIDLIELGHSENGAFDLESLLKVGSVVINEFGDL